MFEILFYTLFIVGILFFVGLSITPFVLPKSLSEDSIWIAPWLGTICITVLGVYLSMLGVPMKYASNILLILTSFIFCFALYKKKIVFSLSNQFILISALVFFIFAFNIYPLFRVGYPTVISLGNLDPLAYVNPADFL